LPWFRGITEVLTVGTLIGIGWFERTTFIRSIGIIEHARWAWLVAAGGFELLSMIAFGRTQRVVLRAAGVRASIPSMAATTFAGNAISVSLPVIGPGAASAFTYGRFRRVADDAAPAGWALLMSGLVSNVVWVLFIAVGATISGNPEAALSGVSAGLGLVFMAILTMEALHRPRWRKVVAQAVERLVRHLQHVSGRPIGEPEDVTRTALDMLSAFRMRPCEWAQAVGLSVLNWLASVACLVSAIIAVGAGVQWTKVLCGLHLRRNHRIAIAVG
jgi:uncharacterized membrane protein YbhN (UPF0104 family)